MKNISNVFAVVLPKYGSLILLIIRQAPLGRGRWEPEKSSFQLFRRIAIGAPRDGDILQRKEEGILLRLCQAAKPAAVDSISKNNLRQLPIATDLGRDGYSKSKRKRCRALQV